MRNLNNFLNNLLYRLKIDFLSENACPFGRFSSRRISFQTLSPRTIKKKRRPLHCWFSSTAASAFRIIQFWKLQSANHTRFSRNFCWFALLQLHTISGIGKPAKPGNFRMHTATSARVFRNTLLNQINCFCCIPRIWMSALWWFCLWKWLIHRCMSHFVVETVGIEPMTSWLPVKRSPSWATPP